MLNNLEHISDELLAAYLDGNTTSDENNLIFEHLKSSENDRKVINIACSALDFPYAYAASMAGRGALCCILSEKLILHKKGVDIPEKTLVRIAEENGWFDPEKGTPFGHIGKLLEFYGLQVERKFCNDIEDLMAELLSGRFVMAYVDGGELTGDAELERIEDIEVGEIPDHAVVVADMIISDNSHSIVLYDLSTENEYDTYTVEQFKNSWKDWKFFMVSVG